MARERHHSANLDLPLRVRLHAAESDTDERVRVARLLSGRGLTIVTDNAAAPDGDLLVFHKIDRRVLDTAADLVAGERPCVAVGLGGGHATSDLLALRRLGVADVICTGTAESMRDALAARFARLQQIEAMLDSPDVAANLVGQSPLWRQTLRKVVEAAHFSQGGILLTGPTGTGKELLSRLIHLLDGREAKRNLVVLDCTTIVPELSGSEFFGHERGAFTNAMCSREGAFALADDGTLFLDEIGELPPSLQAELLRVVQDRTYKRVGSNTWQKAAFRLVCATNRDLCAEQREGRFRSDLYYRLVTHVVHVPALAERVGDIACLADHFLAAARPGLPPVAFDAPVLDWLNRRDYPGNVRELRQLVTAMASRHAGLGPITLGDVPEEELAERDTTIPRSVHAADELGDADAVIDSTGIGSTAVGLPTSVADSAFTPLLRSALRAALADGQQLQAIKRTVGDIAVEEAIHSADGNLRLAARKLGVTDRALQLRGCSTRGAAV